MKIDRGSVDRTTRKRPKRERPAGQSFVSLITGLALLRARIKRRNASERMRPACGLRAGLQNGQRPAMSAPEAPL